MTVTFVPVHHITPSLHGKFLKKSAPQWLLNATSERRSALKTTDASLPPAYLAATPAQRKQLHHPFTASFTAQTVLDKTMANLHGIDTFAEPLLREALKAQYGVVLDVRTTWISLKQATKVEFVEVSTFEYLKLSLLDAAKHNFEASEAEEGAFHHSSGFVVPGATPDTYAPLTVNLKAHQFLALCRSLDIGAKYQTYIKAFFEPADATKAATLRRQFIASQKATMRAAAELALLQQDIDTKEHAMVLSVIGGEVFPMLRKEPVWFCDLGVMKRRLTGCVVFLPCEKYRHAKQCIVYVPHDQKHPMKRFTFAEMEAYFKERFTAADTPAPAKTGPTTYQKFFSQFVPYSDHPYYFGQFTKDGETSWASKFASLVPALTEVLDIFSLFPVPRITNPPPAPKPPQLVEDDPYLDVGCYRQKGQGYWGDNIDLWDYLFDRSCAQSIADAAAHAVPTAEVDARVRAQKIASWLNIGMFAATFFAGFVPVLGEIVLAFMAGQLLNEVFEGAIEWAQGDRKAAKAHLIDLAENLAQLALLHAGGKGVGKLLAIKPPPFMEDLHPVKLPNGQTRLWKSDLSPYKSAVTVPDGVRPNALGQYEINGKTYIRLNNGLYEKILDPALNKWRIKHPNDPTAYQPILEHNQAGAWRHLHERPLEWDRLTLLRRLGHRTEEFSDQALRTIGEVSGVEDGVLRKVHMEGLPIPAALADTLEQFSFDRQVSEVIEQIRRGSGPDSRFECVLPLTVELPRWPQGRVLEVFDGPEPWGASQRYGVTPSTSEAAVSTKLTRSEVQAGKLGEKVLSQLSEDEITRLLGSASGWNGLTREEVFNERLADHALKRQRALFDSLWRSNTPNVPDTSVLGRRYPSLPRQAVNEVLDAATLRERSRLDSGKVPTRLDDLARIRLQQHRLNRAIAGLQRENLASLDSDRLALHSLELLPGWPGGLRLELRGDTISGPLLDSIGAENATVRRYLVQEGDNFQARDERGEPLHSLSPYSRNLYQSILHALPDEFRNGLGIPTTSQDGLLKQTLASYASSHRSEMARILGQRRPRSRPSLRLAGGRLGYELSGRGAGAQGGAGDIDRLITRVRDIYPDAFESEARRFVEERLQSGEHPQQIFNLLANRQRALNDLRSALDLWAGSNRGRLEAADNIVFCWRSGLHRRAAPFSSLSLWNVLEVPALNADFSHVRSLGVWGEALLDNQGAALLQQLPNIRRLELSVGASVSASGLNTLAERLASLSNITELVYRDFGSSLSPTSEVMRSIKRMTQLETLSLSGSMNRLEVSGLVNLRSLEVSGSLATWPEGVLGLEHLSHLELSGTRIASIPPEMLSGHERLWRGLRMNWGNFEPQAFMQAYEHVHDNPAHLVDEEVMVQLYTEGSLRRVTEGDAGANSRALDALRRQRLPANEQVERLDALREEHRNLAQALEQWSMRNPVDPSLHFDPAARQSAARLIRASWREGLAVRLAPDTRPGSSIPTVTPGTRLDFPGAPLGDLPSLPAGAFSHVRHLEMAFVRVPLTELETFLGRFNGVEHLNLADNALTSLPSGLNNMASLRSLNLSHNLLHVTPSIQASLNELASLTSLNLQRNPVRTLDISRLPQLATLDLGRTAISDWPAGALQSSSLKRLDLSHSAVTTIPQAALTGHDQLLANANLRGCRLTPSALAQVKAIGQRLHSENSLGIPRALLEQGRTGGDPEYFPEGTEQNPDLLLPLLISTAGEAATIDAAARMQRLDPSLNTAQAVARIDALGRDGLSALQIEARLVEWEGQQRQWIQALNEWIDIRGIRVNGGWISALDRRQAAERLLSSWRDSLREGPPVPVPQGQQQLDLSGLTLGDLPVLPTALTHIRELNLRGVRITEQGSNEFLRTFSHIETLTLDNNGLRVLPDAVSEFRSLRRLDAAHNNLQDAPALLNMPMLESLNLDDNAFFGLDVSGMSQLQTLDLGNTNLTDWPVGVFQAPRLRTLILRNNEIETIPPEAFSPRHQALMAGTDLHDNLLLEQEFEDLRAYLSRTGNGLGFTLEEIDRMIEGYQPAESEGSGEESDVDQHPEIESLQVQRDRWFTGVAEGSERQQAWDELRADPDSADFFFTLSQLRNTRDFQRNPADVTARVWRVLDALYADPTLRSEVFARAGAARARVTCGDGRILVFNDLETAVYESNARSTVTREQEGAELFRLARRMSRLDAVESLAEEVVRRRPGTDPAEIRLAYRIGLGQRLDLPSQPQGMIYTNIANVTQAALDTAYDTIITNEGGDAFVQSLVQRTYWVDYLRRAYPAEFRTLADDITRQTDALDDRYPDAGEEYLREYEALGRKRHEQEAALAIKLTAQERTRLGL